MSALATMRPELLAAVVSVDPDGEVLLGGAKLSEYTTDERMDVYARALEVSATLAKLAGAIKDSIAADMERDDATTLYHPLYEIKREATKGDPVINGELLYNELTKLANARCCDPFQVAKGVQRIETVVYKTNLTHLKPLFKAGGDVVKVLNAGIRPGEPGPMKLKITARKA